ncbi:MAG: glycerate 2-kinase [Pseudonocardiales bacterium]|nr:glycerate 2-kinase [Pseudonocardiales bacterium]
MKVVAAPDSFRGSLTAAEVAAAMARGVRAVEAGADVVELPVADGGEGTVDSAVAAGFTAYEVRVRGPLGDWVDARIAIRDGHAVVELAELCGWARLPGGRTDPLHTHTAGLGDGIRAALDLGARHVVVGVGGSVSTDGGAGMLAALGAIFCDANGTAVGWGGAALDALHAIDTRELDPRLADTSVVLATDVDNPLLGPTGAAAVFGPQKGASIDDVRRLERGLARLADVVEQATGVPVRDRAGCGAAGGIGATAVPYLHAQIASGADLVLDLLDFDALAGGADLVLTGEGRWDAQTAGVKAPARVTARAHAAGAGVGVVAGRLDASAAELAKLGVAASCALVDLEPDPERAVRDAGPLVERASALVVQSWRAQ